jgi:hypothetical protein
MKFIFLGTIYTFLLEVFNKYILKKIATDCGKKKILCDKKYFNNVSARRPLRPINKLLNSIDYNIDSNYDTQSQATQDIDYVYLSDDGNDDTNNINNNNNNNNYDDTQLNKTQEIEYIYLSDNDDDDDTNNNNNDNNDNTQSQATQDSLNNNNNNILTNYSSNTIQVNSSAQQLISMNSSNNLYCECDVKRLKLTICQLETPILYNRKRLRRLYRKNYCDKCAERLLYRYKAKKLEF